MRRRTLLASLVGAAALRPRAGAAQQPKIPTIGVLVVGSPASERFWRLFREDMRALGYVEGKNVRYEFRSDEGQASRLPALAAELARRGVSGPVEAIEGQAGYYAAFETGDVELLLAGLGQRYETLNTGIKKFPSCACNHAAIQASIDLGRAHTFSLEEMKRVRVRITPYMQQVVGGAFDPSGNLQVAAQFSVKYSVACALLRQELVLLDLTPDRVLEPRVRALADRVEIEVDPVNTGFLAPATVFVEAGEKVFERTIDAVPGSAQAPLSDQEVAVKFQDCMSYGKAMGKTIDATRLFDDLSALEEVEDLNAMMAAAFAPAHRSAASAMRAVKS